MQVYSFRRRLDNLKIRMSSTIEFLDHVDEYVLAPGIDIKTFHLTNSTRIIPKDLSCQICLEELKLEGEEIWDLTCSHLFHKNCALEWLYLSSTCPVCRRSQG